MSKKPTSNQKAAKKAGARSKSTRGVNGVDIELDESQNENTEENTEEDGFELSDAELADEANEANEGDEADNSNATNLPAVQVKQLPSRGDSAGGIDDNFRRYLAEVSRYPIIEPDRQVEMAKKFAETGDMNIARALVTTNLRLVIKIAMEYRNSYQSIMDLVQEGNIGLMKAVSNFDPYKGTRLSYYASWWIRSYILKFLLDNFRLIKIGTTQAQKKLFYNLVREKERLAAQGIEFQPKLLAEKLDVKEKEVKEMSLRLSSSGSEVSIDKPVVTSSGDSISTSDFLVDEQAPVDDTIAEEELKSILADHIGEFQKTLNEKEKTVFSERMINENPKTLQEVADVFGFSRERARQIEAKVLEKLKKFMQAYLD